MDRELTRFVVSACHTAWHKVREKAKHMISTKTKSFAYNPSFLFIVHRIFHLILHCCGIPFSFPLSLNAEGWSHPNLASPVFHRASTALSHVQKTGHLCWNGLRAAGRRWGAIASKSLVRHQILFGGACSRRPNDPYNVCGYYYWCADSFLASLN